MKKTLTIPSDMKVAEPYFIEFGKQLDEICENDDCKYNMRICFGEALANAIVHGNEEKPYKNVRVIYHFMPEDGYCQVMVCDKGRGFDYDSWLERAECMPADALFAENGRGILIMNELADILHYHRMGRWCYFEKRCDK